MSPTRRAATEATDEPDTEVATEATDEPDTEGGHGGHG